MTIIYILSTNVRNMRHNMLNICHIDNIYTLCDIYNHSLIRTDKYYLYGMHIFDVL